MLHTNDFHGRLETDYKGRGGSSYMASIINDIRSSVGEENVALLSAGDGVDRCPTEDETIDAEDIVMDRIVQIDVPG